MKFKMIFPVLLLGLFVLSCSTITANPDFTLTWIDPLAGYAGADVTSFTVSTIEIENNTTVETIIDHVSYEYIYNGQVIYPETDVWEINAVLPASTTVDGIYTKAIIEVNNIAIPFPEEVWNYMVDNDANSVYARVYVNGTDNYGYNKTCIRSFDFGVTRIVK